MTVEETSVALAGVVPDEEDPLLDAEGLDVADVSVLLPNGADCVEDASETF